MGSKHLVQLLWLCLNIYLINRKPDYFEEVNKRSHRNLYKEVPLFASLSIRLTYSYSYDWNIMLFQLLFQRLVL